MPPLAAPNTGPANTVHLEIQRHVFRNTYHPATVIDTHAREEGRGKYVGPPFTPSIGPKGLPSTEPRRALTACVHPGEGQG